MEKIALVTDTTSDLNEEIINKYNIQVLPFRIIYKNKEYRDKIDITAEKVYENLKKEIPTSSMPAIQDMDDLYNDLEKKGYTHVIGITLSSGLSGVFNGLNLVSDNHPNIKSFIYDSKSISWGEGALVVECGKLLAQGKNFQDIVKAIPNIKKRISVFFLVGTLEYLKKGGRIGRVSGTIGELLNVKPIISIDEDGKYFTFDKVRGRKQSLNRIIEVAKEILSKDKCTVYIMHGYGEEEAKKIFSVISELQGVQSITFGGCISPVSGVHSGPGLIGMVFVKSE